MEITYIFNKHTFLSVKIISTLITSLVDRLTESQILKTLTLIVGGSPLVDNALRGCLFRLLLAFH
jgi:hypothetical protein